MSREGPFSSFGNRRLLVEDTYTDSFRRDRSKLDSGVGGLSIQKISRDVCAETWENVTNVRNC